MAAVQPALFEPRTATPEQWARYHAFRRRRHEESAPDLPFDSDRLHEIDRRRDDPQTITQVLVTDDGREMIAAGRLFIPRPGSPGFESNRGILSFDLYVLKAHRRQGVARSYLRPLAEIARGHGCRVIGSESDEPGGNDALRALGMEKKAAERYSRLDLGRVDWALVRRWSLDGGRRNPDRNLQRHLNLPPRAAWPEYARAMTELFNTVPWEDAEHGDVVITPETLAEQAERLSLGGGRVISFVVREADGRLTGITEMALWEEQPEHARQWLTAVHQSVQGNGIGRWIKAEMLLHLRHNHPRVRWVLTGNASSNAPMLKINTELGFETYKVATTYQMPFAEFEKAVSAAEYHDLETGLA